ncbi:MAG: prepilin-type N-terminal cleavage/methylation domain-containing protein [Gammaproteobacteria bacterium]|nr:prepilin-type N-terminal cleavage/methylation domain-containing protein [Gammaproteobacteria bacterium]
MSRFHSGFTLLEMMVVVTLMALTVTFVVLNFNRDEDKIAELEARRFGALIEHLRDESMVTGQTFAIEVDESARRYRFLTPGEEWEPIEGDDVLRPRQLPDSLSVTLKLLDSGASDDLVVVEAIGEITPFELTIGSQSGGYLVSLDPAQNVKVTRLENESG